MLNRVAAVPDSHLTHFVRGGPLTVRQVPIQGTLTCPLSRDNILPSVGVATTPEPRRSPGGRFQPSLRVDAAPLRGRVCFVVRADRLRESPAPMLSALIRR